MTAGLTLLQRIDDYLNAAPARASDVEQIGPFRLFFRRDTPIPELCYARPTDPLTGDLGERIAQVRAAFAARGLPCRWEFLADLAPELPTLLVRHGFPEPLPRPLMVVTPETYRPASAEGVAIRRVEKGESLAISRVLDAAFGEHQPDPAADQKSDQAPETDLLGGMIERGSAAYAAYVGARPVGAGLHVPVGDTTEVAGIGTLSEFRRRGVAGAVTAALVADAFARGCSCVFLSAADETVQRVYARIGFAKIGTAMDTMEARSAARGA